MIYVVGPGSAPSFSHDSMIDLQIIKEPMKVFQKHRPIQDFLPKEEEFVLHKSDSPVKSDLV